MLAGAPRPGGSGLPCHGPDYHYHHYYHYYYHHHNHYYYHYHYYYYYYYHYHYHYHHHHHHHHHHYCTGFSCSLASTYWFVAIVQQQLSIGWSSFHRNYCSYRLKRAIAQNGIEFICLVNIIKNTPSETKFTITKDTRKNYYDARRNSEGTQSLQIKRLL